MLVAEIWSEAHKWWIQFALDKSWQDIHDKIVFCHFQDTLTQWRKVFYIAAAVSIVGNLFYVVFASAKEQSWSLEISNKIKDEKEKEINRASECISSVSLFH